MMGRSEKRTAHFEAQFTRIARKHDRLQKEFGSGQDESHAEHALQNIRPDVVRWTIECATPILFGMHLSILTTDDELGFVTSDAPAFMYNPIAYKLPPFYRSPGLLQKEIEVTLPITPRHLLLYRHDGRVASRLKIPRSVVDEANRNLVWTGTEIVSWKGQTRPEWFVQRDPPPDAWENTPEGRASAQAPALPE